MAAEEYRDAYIHVVDRDAGYGMRKLPIIHFDMLAIAGDALRFAPPNRKLEIHMDDYRVNQAVADASGVHYSERFQLCE